MLRVTLSHNGPDVIPWAEQMYPRRDDEPWIAKHRPGKLVREHLGANGSQRDRRLLLRGSKLRVDLLRGIGEVITQGG